MQEIRISEDIYRDALQAAKAQRVSVEQFVSEAIRLHLYDDPENLDHRFTPEVIAHLDRIAAEADNGAKVYTPQEVDEALKATKAEWLRSHPH